MKLAKELKRLRKDSGFTLREVSKKTGVSNAYVNQLENNKVAEPSPNILAKLAELYDVSYTRLMGLAGYRVPDALAFSTKNQQPEFSSFHGFSDLNFREREQVRTFVAFLLTKRKDSKSRISD